MMGEIMRGIFKALIILAFYAAALISPEKNDPLTVSHGLMIAAVLMVYINLGDK